MQFRHFLTRFEKIGGNAKPAFFGISCFVYFAHFFLPFLNTLPSDKRRKRKDYYILFFFY